MSEMDKIASGMSQDQLIEALLSCSKAAKKNFQRKNRTSESEIVTCNYISRAKSTTLVANSFNATRVFNQNIEHIKIILKYIF